MFGQFRTFLGTFPGAAPGALKEVWRARLMAPKRPSLDRDATYQRILATVDAVPRGRVATYGQIADEAGLPGWARQVGYALRSAPQAAELPWFRVVNARGRSSFPAGSSGQREQHARLRAEGVEIDEHGAISLRRFGWRPAARQR